MTNHREDIPDLPAFHFWLEDRVPSCWHREGMPVMQVRRRTLFGSKLVAQIAMPELITRNDPTTKIRARENAQHALGKVIGL